MLKKAGFVATAAAGLIMIGGTAFAAPAADHHAAPAGDDKGYVTFQDAYKQFIVGGGAVGYGAASLVAGAYVGVLQTPQNILDNATGGKHLLGK